MDATLFLAIAFLTAFVANLVDWMCLQRGLAWVPKGPVAYVSYACIAVISASAFAVLVGWISTAVFPWIAVPYMIVVQLATIWARHASSQPRES